MTMLDGKLGVRSETRGITSHQERAAPAYTADKVVAPETFTFRGYSGPAAADPTTSASGETSLLKSIDWGGVGNIIPGGNVIKVYFAGAGEKVDGTASQGWTAYEKQQAMIAFQQYEHIIDVTVVETANRKDAYFKLATTTFSGGLLGHCGPPGEANQGQGVFGRNGPNWNTGGLDQGGYSFITLIHEFGHGFGLAHPHDTGGGSLVMHGVSGPFGDFGDNNLNQGIFTTMSYNDGYQSFLGESPSYNYGYQGTMMALDVAVLQLKYGANMDYHTGKDVYTLAGKNAPGTMFSCIWDAGGKDSMVYKGAKDCFIDLRAATLDYSDFGGGAPSLVDGVYGGFTIANGVMIERGTGGSGDDWVVGNQDNNTLTGGDGTDSLASGGGKDLLVGGAGDDFFYFDVFDGSHVGVVKDFQYGTTEVVHDQVDLQYIDADINTAGMQKFTFCPGPDYEFTGVAGQIRLTVDAGIITISLDVDGDAEADMQMLLKGGYTDGDIIYFSADSLVGGVGKVMGDSVGFELVV
ncbi:MAG: M10 family metallopeptidase [Caulobacteraceae bacterium]